MLVGLDFETYGSVDLRKHGLDRYISDPYFMPLIGSMYYERVNLSAPTHGGSPHRELIQEFDFVVNMDRAKEELRQATQSARIAAHNSGFEIAVLNWLDIQPPLVEVIDTAVVARIHGAGSKLEAAAPQLLGVDKMEEGRALIKLFSIPGKYQEENGSKAFDPRIVADHPAEWKLFKKYCGLDSKLCYRLAKEFGLSEKEQDFQVITQKMNMLGWHVDVALVEEMQRRYLENLELEREHFAQTYDADLNLNSLKQLKEWCADRGVKATSFDEKHVSSMLSKIEAKLNGPAGGALTEMQVYQYGEVRAMLKTKQILGGSSLKKLQVILDITGEDARLRDQYVHCGAGQSLRTTGRSVQMQNLKRLGKGKIDMDTLLIDEHDYDNDTLAENIRQLFTATDPAGALIVGDFKSVESRGLAWLAHEDWKLDAYRREQDLYVVLAEKFGKDRQFGKVGELSCGYQAGPDAVREFAAKMGTPLTEGEASQLVYSWRDACPRTVEFWDTLNTMLHQVVSESGPAYWELSDGFRLKISTMETPDSLVKQHGHSVISIEVIVLDPKGSPFLRRVFLGAHERGRNICYYKPSDRKTGDLWKNHYTDPKTKKVRFYEIYGGKLAGILTQSFCRELFFQSLKVVDEWTSRFPNLNLVGQFHDEIVLDWAPVLDRDDRGGESLDWFCVRLEDLMSDPGLARSFPLAAEVKHDYRYTK